MNKIAVIGLGSGGIQSLCHMLSWLNGWEVTSIHDPNINIVGIGESTNPSFISALEYGLEFNIADDLEELDATLKLGTRYKKWREKEFTNPLITGTCAIHFNTYALKQFAIPRLKKRWGDKFKVVEATVTDVIDGEDKAVVKTTTGDLEYDFVIDCRGFPSDFTGYTLHKPTLNHALVHNVKKPGDWMYTGHVATKDGWMFEIPLKNRQSYGYMFHDEITSVEEAKKNFSEEIGVPVEEMDSIEYKFKPYHHSNVIGNRVACNGNRAVFFEPMFANSLWLYAKINELIVDYVRQVKTRDTCNQMFDWFAMSVYEVICFQYHGGSQYKTKYWDYVTSFTKDVALNSIRYQLVNDAFKVCNKANAWANNNHIWVYEMLNLRIIDKNFEYNYFGEYND